MPLYDFHCPACDQSSTLLLKVGEAAICPTCGGQKLEKLMSPFSFRGASAATKPAAAPSTASNTKAKEPGKHVCTGGCQHGTADALVKKYLGP